MSDRIQEQRPSALPYALGGAAVGGVGGYFGATKIDGLRKYVSEPAKYESFEQLAKEASDKDAFVKTIDAAEGETKTLLEKMKDFDEKKIVQEAEEKWQNEFNEFKASKQVGLPEDHELLKQKVELEKAKNNAQKALDDKIATLEKAEAEKLAKAGVKVDTKGVKEIQAKIDAEVAQLNRKNKGFDRVLDNIAENNYAEIEKGGANIKAMEKNQDKLLKHKIREFTGAKPDALFADDIAIKEKEIANINEQIKKATSKLEKMNLEDKRDTLVREIKANSVSTEAENLLTEARNTIQNRIAIKEIEAAKVPAYSFGKTKESAEKALKAYSENLGKIKTGIQDNSGLQKNIEAFLEDPNLKAIKENTGKFIKDPNLERHKQYMENLVKAEKLKLDKVKYFQEVFNKASKAAKPEETKEVEYLVKAMFGGEEIEGLGLKVIKTEKAKQLKGAFDSLSKDDVATLRRLVGENPNAESLSAAIGRIEGNINAIETSTSTLSSLQAEIEKVAGKGAKLLEDGTLVNAKGEKVVAKMAVPESLRTKVSLPESGKLKGLRKSLEKAKNGTGSSVEEFAAQAKEIVAKDPSKFAAESNALKEATTKFDDIAKKITEETSKLGNNVDEKSLIEEFAKSGKGTKEEAGKKAVQSFKDDVAALFEGKISNKKLAIGVAAVATAGLALGLLLRPSAKEQA